MANVIGEGVEALAKWIRECQADDGSPQIRTRFIDEFKDKVIVACYMEGKAVRGGTITGLPPQLVDELRQLHGDKRIEAVFNWLRAHGGSIPQAAVATI